MRAHVRTRKWALTVFGLGLGLGPWSGCGAQCKDRVAALQAIFAGLPQVVHDQPGLELQLEGFGRGFEDKLVTPPSAPLDLPRAAEGQAVHRGYVLVMRADGRMSNALDEVAATPQGAASDLAMSTLRLKYGAPERSELPVLFAFEQGAPLQTIAELIPLLADPQLLPSGETLPSAAFSAQLLAYPPDWRAPTEDEFPPWMKVRVDTLRTKFQTDMREGRSDPVHTHVTCPAMLELLAATGATWQFPELVRRLPHTIVTECGCSGVDVEGLAAWMWIRYEPWQPVVRGQLWAFGAENAEVVEFPAGATVSDLLPVIQTRAGRPFRIAVAPR